MSRMVSASLNRVLESEGIEGSGHWVSRVQMVEMFLEQEGNRQPRAEHGSWGTRSLQAADSA